MFKTEAKLFLSANNNVNSAKTLINECKRLVVDFNLEGNKDSERLKLNIERCDINALVTKIDATKESLMKLDSSFASEYMTLLQEFLQTSTIDTSKMTEEERLQYNIQMNSYARDYNQNLLYMLEKYEDSGMLTEEMKQQLEYQRELVAQYDIQDKMAVLDSTTDEYIDLFKKNADCDRNLIKLNPSLTEEQKAVELKNYNIQYNKDLETLINARDSRLKREKDEKELEELYASKEANSNFWHPFVESEINEAILDKKIEMGIASEDEKAYKNMNGWDRFVVDADTFVTSTYTGLFNITEGISDAFVMVGSAVNIVDKNWASAYVNRDISGELYQGIQLSTGMNSYSAYGDLHDAGEAFGGFVGKVGISFAAPWASAALSGLDAMGQSAESAFNDGASYWTAFAKSTVSGVGGAIEGYGYSKLNSGIQSFVSSTKTKLLKEYGIKKILSTKTLGTIKNVALSKLKDTPKLITQSGGLKNLVGKGLKKFGKSIGISFVETLLEPDAMTETGCVIVDDIIDGVATGKQDFKSMAKEAGAVFLTNWGMNFATELAFGKGEMPKFKKQTPTLNSSTQKMGLDDLYYKKVGPLSSSYYMLESNIHKYSYVDTNTIDGLNDSIKQNGLYHFTSEKACDKILESGYVKKSGYITSYGNKKSFFFNGVPEVGAYATNIDKLPVRATAVKVMPDDNLINSSSLKVRSLDDMAITHDGDFKFSSDQASKEYFCLFKEDDKLVYRSVSKEFYDNYPNTESGKLLEDFVSKKSNVSAIKNDFYYNLSMKSSGATVASGNFKSIIDDNANNKTIQDLFDPEATPPLISTETKSMLLDEEPTMGPILLDEEPTMGPMFDPEATPSMFDPEATPSMFDPEATPSMFDPEATPSMFDPEATPSMFDPEATPPLVSTETKSMLFDEETTLGAKFGVEDTITTTAVASTVAAAPVDNIGTGVSKKINGTNIEIEYAYDKELRKYKSNNYEKYGTTELPKELVIDDLGVIKQYEGTTLGDKLDSIRKLEGKYSIKTVTAESTAMQTIADIRKGSVHSQVSSISTFEQKVSIVQDRVDEMFGLANSSQYRHFRTPEEARQYFKNDLDFWDSASKSPQGSNPGYAAMKQYTGPYYDYMNPFMRNINQNISPTLENSIGSLATTLDGFELQEDIILYRGYDEMDYLLKKNGLPVGAENIKLLSGGTIIASDDAFMSATPVMGYGFTYKKIVEVIRAPKGTKGTFIDTFSSVPTEVEFLIQSGEGNRKVIQAVEEIGDQIFVYSVIVPK